MSEITIEDGSIISYRLIGDISKPMIIFTNGSIFNYKQFDHVFFPELHKILGDEYSYLFYDYIGIGNSSEVDEFDYFKIAEQHVELMDVLNIDKAHHFGYSKGGAIIQLVAINNPDRVLTINLLAGPNLAYWKDAIMNEFKDRVRKIGELNHLIEQRINEDNYAEVYKKMYQEMLFDKNLGFMDRIKNWYLRKVVKPMLLDTRISSLEKLYQYYTKELLNKVQQEKYISDLKKLDIPFLLHQGTEDVLVEMQGTIELDSYLKNSKLIKYEGFDHTSPAIIKKQGRQIMQNLADFIVNH